MRVVAVVIALTFLAAPAMSHAQTLLAPDSCPPGFSFVPPSHCVPASNLSPAAPANDPIVLVPPLISSYSKKLMKKDEPGEDLRFVFGGNTFKALIKKLEEVGYEIGEDLFVAHYDWRLSNEVSARQHLKPMINEAKKKTGASKVDLVAHSMGGLVARSYIQGNDYDDDVDQLITLGTPHAGASGAYQAWEGGQYPETWDPFVKFHVDRVEAALKRARDLKNLTRPETFRTFFPSLRDLLRNNDFILRDGDDVSIEDLTEQNTFLNNLRDTFHSIADRGITLATIGAKNQPTLDTITLREDRNKEDIDRKRWRDGHANPDPPIANSLEGDKTVLLSSAHLGDNKTTFDNGTHLELPTTAQNTVLELLGLEEVAEEFEYEPPKKLFGIVILSPLDATIEGPNGELLSKDQNDFGAEQAEYDDDPADPDDPKVITLADPPAGTYTITYTGTDTGDYTIITSYADEDETVSAVIDGQTVAGQMFEEVITIDEATTSLIDDTDYPALLNEIAAMARQTQRAGLLKGYERANLTRPVRQALASLRIYERRLKQGRERAAVKRLHSYHEQLADIEQAATKIARRAGREELVAEVLQHLQKIRLHSPPL